MFSKKTRVGLYMGASPERPVGGVGAGGGSDDRIDLGGGGDEDIEAAGSDENVAGNGGISGGGRISKQSERDKAAFFAQTTAHTQDYVQKAHARTRQAGQQEADVREVPAEYRARRYQPDHDDRRQDRTR